MRRVVAVLWWLGGATAAVGCASGGSSDGSFQPSSGGGGQGGAAGGTDATGGGGASGGDGGTGGVPPAPCADDDECIGAEICQDGACVPGCLVNTDCQSGLTCCDGRCVDVTTSVEHCGGCGNACPSPPHQPAYCSGVCGLGVCEPGFVDCDGDTSTGCEATECSCQPGSTQSCYSGPPGTLGVGECHAGSQTCNADGTAWSLCMGQATPILELCANGLDEDCNSIDDDVPDLDGDGWTTCDGDCCDLAGANCSDPALVNPGALDVPMNFLDDDCDPSTLEGVPPACSTVEKLTGVTGVDVAMAMDLCQFTTLNPPLSDKKWGVISANLVLASGATPTAAQLANLQSYQTAVLTDYGTGGIVPQFGATMAGISSGRMRDAAHADFVAPNPGTQLGNDGTPPGSYLAAHGGALPSTSGCNGTCAAGDGANDSVNVRLQVRVPTNALSMSYRFKFLTAEYWTYACTPYNDFFLALLTSGAAGIPADKNISFDALNNPVSVNNGFFEVCEPKGCYQCPDGFGELAGTGMDALTGMGIFKGVTGGATKWLVTTAPVVPGEVITLELMIFDVTDQRLDSVSLLDAFSFSAAASGVGTEPG